MHTVKRASERAPHASERGGGHAETRGGATQERVTNESQDKESPSNEILPAPTSLIPDPEEESFERFWKAYPRKTAKAAARKVWKRALKACAKEHPNYTPGAIIDGAIRYAEDPNREDLYTTHASTWLNQERWNDPLLPPRGGNRAQNRDDANMAAARAVLGPNRPAIGTGDLR